VRKVNQNYQDDFVILIVLVYFPHLTPLPRCRPLCHDPHCGISLTIYNQRQMEFSGIINNVNKKRPINLNLFSIKFPIMAIASILHRLSGVILFLFIPGLVWMLDKSLASAESFEQIKSCLSSFGCKLLIWILLSAIIYHVIAGFRHLIMDTGHLESLKGGRWSARIVIGLSVILSLLTGCWIW